jgi:gamma-polyglutamate biosynthesis protein CapA
MKRWLFLIVWIGVTGVIGGLLWGMEPNVEQIKSPEPKIFQSMSTPTPKQDKITIAAVGDIGLGRETNYQIIQQNNPNLPFEKIKDVINSADISIGNLEGPVIENCPIIRSGFKFCGQPENIQGLNYAGFDGMSLANNHINNYGLEGITQTTKNLLKNNIDYFYEDKSWITEIKGTKIGFLGFDDTVQKVKSEKLKVKSKEIKKNVDILVINFHWGEEYQDQPNERQKELAKLAIDSGADIIIGHHPHVIQPLEYYQDKPIFYSLGNFVFDQMWSEETKKGAIGLITIENNQITSASIKETYSSVCCQPELIE